ncbi:centriolar coiled-coil protein of 110 kDa-like [Ptychodera flava]|uniref:centriolar coiled-coil protein of 110 kDa-like n=1 Tax=Ptychodera flava TaxID=63121 RepID=UPI00396AB0EA
MGSSYTHSIGETRDKVASTTIERLHTDVKEIPEDTEMDDSGNASGSGQAILHLDATEPDDVAVVGYRSTSSSSDISELNRTVITVNESDDSLPNSSGSSKTVTEKGDSPESQKSASSDDDDTVSPRSSLTGKEDDSERDQEETGSEITSQEDVEQNKQDMFHDNQQISDTESALSLIGDYKPLPMPSSLQIPHLAALPFNSAPSVPDSNAKDSPVTLTAGEDNDAEQYISAIEVQEEDSEKYDESSKHLISTGSSDQHTYGSAADSCSLPISCITDSVDTLRDIQESLDTMNNAVLSAVSEEDTLNERGAPVGQEKGEQSSKSTVAGSTSSLSDSTSPSQTVRRRGSYTLDEPSPALIKAHSDKEDSSDLEKSHESSKNNSIRRSLELEFTSDNESKVDKVPQKADVRKGLDYSEQRRVLKRSKEHREKHQSVTPDVSSFERDSSRGATSGHLFELQQQQMDYFEQLRTQLHEQQKQQLQEVLQQQQREQMLLQREFEEEERRFEEEQRLLMERLTRQHERTENEQWLEKLDQLRSLEGRVESDSESESKHYKPGYADSLEGSQIRLDRSAALPPASYRPHTADPAVTRYPFYLEGHSRNDASSDTSHSTSSVTSSPQLSVSTPLMSSSPQTKALIRKVASREMKSKFNLVSAAVKGYLTRRLLRTEKVKTIAKTIKDTYSFVYRFQEETPVKRGNLSTQDVKLAERVIAQLRAALLDMHEIFFEIPAYERMSIIRHDRILEEERRLLKKEKQEPSKKISEATKKVMERRKQVKAVNVASQTSSRPKTAPPSVSTMKKTPFDARVLKPIQGVQSPRRPADHLYRPGKYVSSKQENRPKTAPEKARDNPVMQPVGSKAGGIHATNTAVTVKSKGARRSLYPVSAVSTKARPKSPRGKTSKRKV